MKETINFQGNCLFKSPTNYLLSSSEKKIFKNLKYNNFDPNLTKNPLYISDDVNILELEGLNNLSNLFDKWAYYYVKNILKLNNKLQKTNSWVTINKTGGEHHVHHHPNSFISLCYYPKIKSGSLCFKLQDSPLSSKLNFDFDIIELNEYNSKFISFLPKPGDIIIFPSWVYHYSEPNESTEDRIMIGANYFLKGELGSDSTITKLKI